MTSEHKQHERMLTYRLQKVAKLATKQLPEGWGFAFLASNYGEGGSLTYVSNIERDDVAKLCLEFAINHVMGTAEDTSPETLKQWVDEAVENYARAH